MWPFSKKEKSKWKDAAEPYRVVVYVMRWYNDGV